MYKIDIHTHTSETSPCGKLDARTLVRLYHAAGYKGIVTTDHYYRGFFEGLSQNVWEDKIHAFLQGYDTAREEGEKLGLQVLLGMEIRFDGSDNDYLVYGIDEAFLCRNRYLYESNIKEFFEGIKEVPILVYQAHPFRHPCVPTDPACIHGVEVYNEHPRHDSQNPKAYAYALQHDLKMISGSDAHQAQDIARGGLILQKIPSTTAELVDILMQDRIVELIHSGK